MKKDFDVTAAKKEKAALDDRIAELKKDFGKDNSPAQTLWMGALENYRERLRLLIDEAVMGFSSAYFQVCDTCGSKNVRHMRWVFANTGEVDTDLSGTEGLVDWCNDCENECRIIDENDFKPRYAAFKGVYAKFEGGNADQRDKEIERLLLQVLDLRNQIREIENGNYQDKEGIISSVVGQINIIDAEIEQLENLPENES